MNDIPRARAKRLINQQIADGRLVDLGNGSIIEADRTFACALCGTRRSFAEMREVEIHAPGRVRTMSAPVCAECIASGPLAPVFAALVRHARAAALSDPGAAS